mmetsp:Transcript_72975/g.128893  ORF Transcript_72975/g.128893 Transcript_72975/m.128893 type:complete len:1358 (+) Transcript_72975:65-4138(+)
MHNPGRALLILVLLTYVHAITDSSLIRRDDTTLTVSASNALELLQGEVAAKDADAAVILESLVTLGGKVTDEIRNGLKTTEKKLKADLREKKQRVWVDNLKESMDALKQCVIKHEQRANASSVGGTSEGSMVSQLYTMGNDHRNCRMMEDQAKASITGCETALRKEEAEAVACSKGKGEGDCLEMLLKVTNRGAECKSYADDHKQVRERCHYAQALLENAACELSKKNKICEDFLQCQSKHMLAYEEAKTIIKREEEKLIPETSAVEQIDCILKAQTLSVHGCGSAAPSLKIFTSMSVDDVGRVLPEQKMLMAESEDLRFPEAPRSRACEAWQGEKNLLEGFYAGLPKGALLNNCNSECCQHQEAKQAVLLQDQAPDTRDGPHGFLSGIPVYASKLMRLSSSFSEVSQHMPLAPHLAAVAEEDTMAPMRNQQQNETQEPDLDHAKLRSAAPAPCPSSVAKEAVKPAAPAPCPSVAKEAVKPVAPAPCPSPIAKEEIKPAPCPSPVAKEAVKPLAPAPCPSPNQTVAAPMTTTTTTTATTFTSTTTEERTVTLTTTTLTTITETETSTTSTTTVTRTTTETTTKTTTVTDTTTITLTSTTRTSTTVLTETTTSTTTAEATTTIEEVNWRNFGAGAADVIGNNHPCKELHGRENWIIKLPETWTDDKIKQLAEKFPSEDKYVGHPSARGLPILIVWADQNELSAALAEVPGAEYVEIDSELSADTEDFHAEFEPDAGKPDPVPWGLDRIDNEGELDGRYTAGGPDGGRGVHIYVMDTGIRTTHGQFGGRAIPTLEVKSGKVVPCSSTDVDCAVDNHGHGTHQAGVIGGGTVGVAQGSWLHAVKILSDTGQGTLSSFLMAADWLLVNANRPAVVNLALSAEVHTGDARILKDVIDRMVARDIPVIVPAGQENDNACFYSPSDVTAAITVGASGPDDKRAAFSSFGTCVDLFAPGSKVVTAGIRSDRSYAVLSSTALAASHVTGAVAMFLALANGTAAQDEVEKEIVRAAFAGLLKNVQDSPNKLLGIRWSALKPVLIGQSEPHAPPPGQAKKDFRKKCVRAPSAGLLCPSNAGDYGQRLGFDRFRDQFHITVEGNQVCAQRYDQEEDDFLPSTKYSASSFDEGGWTINLVVLCHQKLLAKTDKWLFTRLGDPGEPSVCAGSNPTDRSKLYYVAYEDVTQEADCKKLCQLRYGCKAFSLNGKTCEVWLKDAKSFLRLPKDYPTDNSVSCNRFIGRGSAGSGSLRLAAAPTKCLQVENDILKVTTCAHEETQQFTWDGVGPITLTGKSGQCLTLTNKSAPVKMDACSADGPVPSQTFAFEGTGTISWMDIITHDKLCLATNGDGPMKISPCDIKSPSMQFFY